MDKSNLANLIIGIVIGAVITAWMHVQRKPKLQVTVDLDPDEPDSDTARVLNIEGSGPDGMYQTRDLFFAASILAHRLTQESEESFEDTLETFCDCVRDIDQAIGENADEWMDGAEPLD